MKYSVAFILLISVCMGVAYFLAKKYEPEVKEIVVYELNRHLAVKVKVGDINLSLLQRFPYASLRFSDVVIPEVINGVEQADTLLYVKDLYLQIGLFDFLRKNYTVTEAELNSGYFDMAIFDEGGDNYHFWKAATDTSSSTSKISITDIVINDFGYRLSAPEKLILDLHIDKMKADGMFGSDVYDIETDHSIFIKTIAYQNDTLYRNETLSGDLNMNIDDIADRYSFNSKSLKLADQPIGLTGNYVPAKDQSWNLAIVAENANLTKLTHLLPQNMRSRFAKYEAKGKTDINIKLSAGKDFNFTAAFSDLSGSFQHNEALGTAEIDHAEGKLEVAGGISSLFLDELEASIGAGSIKSWGKIIDFEAPSFDLNLEGEIDLQELKSLLNIQLLQVLEGEIKMDGRLQGRLPRQSNNETLDLLKGIDFTGKINLDDGAFQMKDQQQLFDRINGTVQLKDNSVIISKAEARVNKNPFRFSGTIKNALPYISQEGQRLFIIADFGAEELDLNAILASTETRRDTVYNFHLPKDISFELGVDIGKLNFRKFEAGNIAGKAHFSGGLLTLNPISFKTAGGLVRSNLSFKNRSDDTFEVNTLAKMEGLDLSELFVSFENFGQEVVQDKHLEGKATATISFSALVGSDLSIDSKSIRSNIDLTVFDGKLKKLESLQAISDYLKGNAIWRSLIKVKEFEKKLQIVEFDTLQNTIVIENSVVRIPAMRIGSSALSLFLAGTHSFDNQIDYSINFKLNDLLRTGKKETSEFGYIVDDPSGLRLFMRMYGTVDEPEFSLDGNAARDKRKQQLEDEKTVFKSILKDEFGLFKSDSTLTGLPSKERDKPKFSIDLDEFKSDNDTDHKSQKKKRREKDLYGDDDL